MAFLPARSPLPWAVLALLLTHCGGFFDAGGGGGGAEPRGGRGHRGGDMANGCDPSGGPVARTPDAGVSVDTGVLAPDSGVETPDTGVGTEVPSDAGAADDAAVEADAGFPPECLGSWDCAVGSQCNEGFCVACPNDLCPCARDPECPADQVCNHMAGICEPPYVPCADVHVEADCLGRSECQAIYSGQNCTNENGGECTSSDPNCTCETFGFAICIDRI